MSESYSFLSRAAAGDLTANQTAKREIKPQRVSTSNSPSIASELARNTEYVSTGVPPATSLPQRVLHTKQRKALAKQQLLQEASANLPIVRSHYIVCLC